MHTLDLNMINLYETALDQIKDVKYFYDEMLTICVITTLSGFKVIGTSSTIDPEKYSQITGMETARKKATDSLVEHVAYAVLLNQ